MCDVYVDEAVSGADVSRQEYIRLKTDAAEGKVDYIVVDDLSRIGRDMPEFTSLYQELDRLGVILVGVADGIDTSRSSAKIPIYIKGMMNELFLDDLKLRIVRGLKGQVLRGYSTGGRVFGYRTEPVYDPGGGQDKFGCPKRLGCRILVNEEEAGVVNRIFGLRQSGLGYRAIAVHLNDAGIPSPRADTTKGDGLWSVGIQQVSLGQKAGRGQTKGTTQSAV